jgi:hypothetical protein
MKFYSVFIRMSVQTNLLYSQSRSYVKTDGFFYLVCEAIGTAATPGLLCQPRVIVKMIVGKLVKCRLAGETCPGATFVHHKIPHHQTRVWTRAAAVGSRRLTAWAIGAALDRRLGGQSVFMSSSHPGPKTRFLLLSESAGFFLCGEPSLTKGRSCLHTILML